MGPRGSHHSHNHTQEKDNDNTKHTYKKLIDIKFCVHNLL